MCVCGGGGGFLDQHSCLVCMCGQSEFRSCVKVEVAILGSLSLIVLMVSVDIKQH